ncbi:S-adenosyl-L-methionine-dependent methyltransferase [Coniella lustricola]|uniref:S-adenosyl-L-methionine-dependent methyltransferase n=1 Tax=Coniella lustricola TaxID=2025994 RepID=A0A2T2ZYL7_9PEZI|nr:S-adenosyl-L-methionine-dependent methyltransferase [Coniella lustricola]
MDALLEQVQTLAVQADHATRHKVLSMLRSLQLRLETPHDTLSRYSGLHLEIAAVRIAEDLGIFQALSGSTGPLTTAELASKNGASPLLLWPDAFTANALTKTLSQPGYRGGIYHFFDNCGPVFQALPSFLAESKYQDVTDAAHTAFQKAFPTELPAFMWLPTQTQRFEFLQQVMTVQGADGIPWFSVFPLEKQLTGFDGQYVLIDVGGGFGHQCAALLGTYQQLKGKLVLQDLPPTLNNLSPGVSIPAGVKVIPHDFFQEQPIKGARFYYQRNILHDWPDDKCVTILKQLSAAFGPDSQILIDEMVLPDAGVAWEAATVDLTMMSSLGSRERTLQEWHALLDKAGLKALYTYTYIHRRMDSIIHVALK